ncbi:MAG: hypothetical protein ACK559_36180 [bacterium]
MRFHGFARNSSSGSRSTSEPPAISWTKHPAPRCSFRRQCAALSSGAALRRQKPTRRWKPCACASTRCQPESLGRRVSCRDAPLTVRQYPYSARNATKSSISAVETGRANCSSSCSSSISSRYDVRRSLAKGSSLLHRDSKRPHHWIVE